MKYEFKQYKDKPEVILQTANAEIVIKFGEAICETDAQKSIAELNWGIPAVAQKSTPKVEKAKSND